VNLFDVAIVLIALLAVTIVVASVIQWRRLHPQMPILHEVIEPHRLGADELGTSATLLQFSKAACVRCPGVHRTLRSVADEHDGVLHLDVDVTDRPDIARHFVVSQTPITLILDRHGMVQSRLGGPPGRDVVELELARMMAADAETV